MKVLKDEDGKEYFIGVSGARFNRCAGCDTWVTGYKFCFSCYKNGSTVKGNRQERRK